MRRLEKISLCAVALCAITWLGGSSVRAMVGFDLLEMGTLDFKPNIHPYVERAVYGLIAQSSLPVDVSYVILWIAGIMFLRTTHLSLKQQGWLVMAAILFYMFTPVEIYLMVLDTKIWILDHIGSNDLVEFRKLFIHRLAALSGVPLIAALSYYAGIAVTIFQPLRLVPPGGADPV